MRAKAEPNSEDEGLAAQAFDTSLPKRALVEGFPDPRKNISECIEKQEQLLVIGFDERPKGINPLTRLRSPGGAAAVSGGRRSKPHGNHTYAQKGKLISQLGKTAKAVLDLTNGSGFSNPGAATPKYQPLAATGFPASLAAEERARRRKEDAELLMENDAPNLQEYARQRKGKMGPPTIERGRRPGGTCRSPEPRRTHGLPGGQPGGDGSGFLRAPFGDRHEKSQPPKARENKTKEELARIRRGMMRTRLKDREDPLNPLSQAKAKNAGGDPPLETAANSSAFIMTPL